MLFLFGGIVVLLISIFGGMLIGASTGFAALLAHGQLGLDRVLFMVANNSWAFARSFTLTAVPLFILMGEIVARSGLIFKLFDSFIVLTRGKLPGGLLQPTLFTSAIWSACSGSSTATAAALSGIIYPPLKKFNYPDGIATATIAAGASMDMLIPPSILMVLYGAIADTSVGALYLGAVIPGVMVTLFFMTYIALKVPKMPALPEGEQAQSIGASSSGKTSNLQAVVDIGVFALLMLTVLAPLYLGIATATEVAALGTAGSILITLGYKKFSWKIIWESAMAAVTTTSLCYFILFGTITFSMALSSAGVSAKVQALLQSLGGSFMIFTIICVFYLILGMLFDPISILLLTTPLVVPILTSLGFTTVWAGIYLTVMIEIGMLTPPVGFNLFVVSGVTRVPMMTIAKACIPFNIILIVVIYLFYYFPWLIDWLPKMAQR